MHRDGNKSDYQGLRKKGKGRKGGKGE